MQQQPHPLRIKALRKAKNLTQEDLADMAGLSRSLLAEIENGTAPANTYRLAAIARALGITVPDLFDAPQETWKVEIIELLGRLGPEDRAAVIRHARALVAEVSGS